MATAVVPMWFLVKVKLKVYFVSFEKSQQMTTKA